MGPPFYFPDDLTSRISALLFSFAYNRASYRLSPTIATIKDVLGGMEPKFSATITSSLSSPKSEAFICIV